MFFTSGFIFFNFILLCILICYICGVVGYFIRPKSLASFFIGFFFDIFGWIVLAILRVGDKIDENSDKYNQTKEIRDSKDVKSNYNFIKSIGFIIAALFIITWFGQGMISVSSYVEMRGETEKYMAETVAKQEQERLDILKREQEARDRILAIEEKRRQDEVIRFATEQAQKEKEHQEYLKREAERQEAIVRRKEQMKKEQMILAEAQEKQAELDKIQKMKDEQDALKLSLALDRQDLMIRKEIMANCETLTKRFNDTGENITIKNLPTYYQIYDEMKNNVNRVNEIQEKNRHLVIDEPAFKEFKLTMAKVADYSQKSYAKQQALNRYADEQELKKLQDENKMAEYRKRKAELDAQRKLEQQNNQPQATPARTVNMGVGKVIH